MIRVVIENLLLFLLPTVIYLVYTYMTRPEASATGEAPPRILDDAPLIWLFLAGTVLVIVTLVAVGSTSGGRPGQHYEPPVMKDGQIQPGHID
jgi:hypothetical protein